MEAATAEQKRCHRCGKEVEPWEIPDELEGTRWGEMLARLPKTCAECAKIEDEQERAEAREAERQREVALYESRRAGAGIPPLLATVSFGDLNLDDTNQAAILAAREWATGNIAGLLLSGPVGVGKTWTAAAAANVRLSRAALRWFSVPRLMAQARAGFETPARDELNDVLLNPQTALVLDDIDKTNPTAFARDILFEVIDERINAGTALLVTTNLRSRELTEMYGEPIVSRLVGYCATHRIGGADRRRRQAA